MIQIEINQDQLERLYLQKVEERLNEIESKHYFMDSKQLTTYLNMSWPTVVKHFLYEEEFGAIRLGSKWLFNRKEVDKYMDKFYKAVRDSGGDIQKYVSKF
ncbi:DNA-binding protein [Sporosarcina limicola]|uniref:Excisionase family DNA binding protein n=1 Tax=Sporosarcina limicola TaxID=34101 RepID=A0A927MN52_9BACL|nr:DNA-binding protein [Sporosarcina limicola]MBE1557008.1 excisionase family DNA binding protein [Sporosarcina limicola]